VGGKKNSGGVKNQAVGKSSQPYAAPPPPPPPPLPAAAAPNVNPTFNFIVVYNMTGTHNQLGSAPGVAAVHTAALPNSDYVYLQQEMDDEAAGEECEEEQQEEVDDDDGAMDES